MFLSQFVNRAPARCVPPVFIVHMGVLVVIDAVVFDEELRRFREQAHRRAYRDPDLAAWWAHDLYDRHAAHFVTRDDHGEIAGSMRVLLDGPWPIPVDTENGVYIGKMAVRRMELRGRRALIHLLLHGITYGADAGRSVVYATAERRTLALYRRFGVPFDVVPGVYGPRGPESCVIRGDLEVLVRMLEPCLLVRTPC